MTVFLFPSPYVSYSYKFIGVGSYFKVGGGARFEVKLYHILSDGTGLIVDPPPDSYAYVYSTFQNVE